ncbi:5-oxoprolinase subunit PxpB [Marinomonas transparens]|uniref:5-oxoprolinase subunit PxpB n=1 Tax=Marinomonas transparens TaxID=2795388 RepID=A0A934N0I9_9GAMM|nr:5-oxoprolinase subunit PxpB [Marinomonas transparens]MBJ7538615.1 5-oxoprolinase subunit PxpB [Marinomonas transparens]
MRIQDQQPLISLLGTSAVLLQAPAPLLFDTQQKIWGLAQQVEGWEAVLEVIPGMNNLMITYPTLPEDMAGLKAQLLDAWQAVEGIEKEGKVIDLPVIYGGPEYGPHMQDVVAHTGLSIAEIVRRHTAPLYPVYALGSHPGFCYLGDMDPSLATPRRQVPITDLAGGSVSIGGVQTGVSASQGPSGWNTIGRTKMQFFDVNKMPPALCKPGDYIRFCVEEVIQ